MHEALCTAFEQLYSCLPDARFERRDGYILLTCAAFPIPQFNGILLDSADAEPAPRDLADAVAEVERLGVPCGVQVRAGKTEPVEDGARRLGLTVETPMPGMAATPDDLRPPGVAGLELVRAEDQDALAEAARIAAAGFKIPQEFIAPLYSDRVASLPGLEIYLGLVEGRSASTAVGFAVDGSVGIFNVATPPEHRRRGYGGAVTAHAAREAFARGADLAWLQSSTMGESVYRGLGFRQVETYLLFSRPTAH